MQHFSCARCGNRLFFENVRCLVCGSRVGFDPRNLQAEALDVAQGETYRPISTPSAVAVSYCANVAHAACNWLVPAGGEEALCPACALNRTIPDLSAPKGLEAWQRLERAKKRLIYSLLRLGLPLVSRSGAEKLTFDFLRDASTGHANGVITVDVMEADSVERERQREQLGEPYRSLLGHLRHETGHFYWNVLVRDNGRTDEFRAVFGDERQDYGAALDAHYAAGPPADWQTHHVSAYASSHPWEDWAETWAHYLHMLETLDTAASEGIEPRAAGAVRGAADVYVCSDLGELLARWVPLTVALNRLSRSMGHPDFYPFVISASARAKLEFAHQCLLQHRFRHQPASPGMGAAPPHSPPQPRT